MADIELFGDLLCKCKKILTFAGIWPSDRYIFVTLFNISVLSIFPFLVIAKSSLEPDAATIENAFTLANGGLIIVPYFLTVLAKKEKLLIFLNFIINDVKRSLEAREKQQLLIQVGKEFDKILKVALFILPIAVSMKFIQPLLEFSYIKVFGQNEKFQLPPTMAIPNDLMGEFVTYIVESMIRSLMLCTLMGTCILFIVTCLHICTQFKILAVEFENLSTDNDEKVLKCINRHQELLT